MEGLCWSGKSHRWEYWDCKEGIEWFRCMNANCGETMQRYHDTSCGG